MNIYFTRLLAHIPNGIPNDPQSIPSLTLSGTGNVSIQGDMMFVSTASQSVAIDLHGQTVQGVVNQLPTGVTGTVLQNGMAELLIIPDMQGSSILPVTLQIASYPLWFIIGMMARMLESRKRSINTQVAQMNLQAATSILLDWWGATLGVERIQSEPDLFYAQRIIGLKLSPNVNNVALELFFEKLGYPSSIPDTSYGNFSVNITLPTASPSGFVYSLDNVQESLNLLKAAGTIAYVVLNSSLVDSVILSESLTGTLSTYPFVYDTGVIYGQGTWG